VIGRLTGPIDIWTCKKRHFPPLFMMKVRGRLYIRPKPERDFWGVSRTLVYRALRRRSLRIVQINLFDESAREEGKDWPMFGYTMIGRKRLSNIQFCIENILEHNVEGGFVECGVWRGGASIFARAVLDAQGGTDRTVWLADSFRGMPVRTSEDDLSDRDLTNDNSYSAVSLEEVRANFARFDLLSDQVKFLKGWFCDTLPHAPIGKIAILRLDGDYYNSTMDPLKSLYDRVSIGGYIIVEDYNIFTSCRKAVADFCVKRSIKPDLRQIDSWSVFWQKIG
jgi:hypothetical protein